MVNFPNSRFRKKGIRSEWRTELTWFSWSSLQMNKMRLFWKCWKTCLWYMGWIIWSTWMIRKWCLSKMSVELMWKTISLPDGSSTTYKWKLCVMHGLDIPMPQKILYCFMKNIARHLWHLRSEWCFLMMNGCFITGDLDWDVWSHNFP